MIKNKKKALSLTEMLIVLVVIALLFAALSPIITKKHAADRMGNDTIWNFVSYDDERDSFFDPEVKDWTSSVYVNSTPDSNDKYSGKLVINAGDVNNEGTNYTQHHIQFRYGSGRGINAGNMLVRRKDYDNVITGPDSSLLAGSKNTAAGLFTLNGFSAYNTVAIGDHSLANSLNLDSSSHFLAIGSHAGEYAGYNSNAANKTGTYIGANSGATENNPNDLIAIGYNSAGNRDSEFTNSVFIGANSGGGDYSYYDTIVGSDFVAKNSANNTIIGYGTYHGSLDTSIKNITAIGFGACESISNYNYSDTNIANTGSRICLGYNSGAKTNNTPESFQTDNGEHIFIGGVPFGGFAGRSVLEVHRNSNGSKASVVLNSNIAVRGDIYWGSGDSVVKITNDSDTVANTVSASGLYNICSSDSFKTSLLNFYNGFICESMVENGPLSQNVLKAVSSCTIGNSGCVSYSDERLKSDINPNTDGLNKIMAITPYNYVFKSDSNKTPQVGVIAQDLKEIFSNSVVTGKDGFLKIRLDEMFFAMINAIKELDAKLNIIASKITDLHNDINFLTANNKNIHKRLTAINARIKRLEHK